MKDLLPLFQVGMLLASGMTSYASLRQPTSNNWSRWEDEDSPLFSQPGTALMVGSTCILHHSSTPVQTASFLSFKCLSQDHLQITDCLHLEVGFPFYYFLHPETNVSEKVICTPLLLQHSFFHPFVTNPLEITFSLAKWDHRQVESENPLTLQLSPSLKCDTIPLTTLSLASIMLCCLSCSFWIVLSPTFTGTFFFLLLTWRHCLGSLLHPLLILNNLYAISV